MAKWRQLGFSLIASLLMLHFSAYADSPSANSGQTKTFEPGTKHICLPANQGWNCVPSAQFDASVSLAPGSPAPTETSAAATSKDTRDAPSSQASAKPHASELPSYLTHAATQTGSAPNTIQPGSSHTLAPSRASPAEKASLSQPPTASETAHDSDNPNAINGNSEFLTLPGNQYVIELAHSDDPHAFDAILNALKLRADQLYRLHFPNNKNEQWMLVWAGHDSITHARAALSHLSPTVALNAGWPRRIAPLQTELRNTH